MLHQRPQTVTASTAALVADCSKAQCRGGALGILSTTMDIGQASGPIVTGFLIGAYSYRTAFVVVGAILLVVSLVFGIAMHALAHPESSKAEKS